MESAWQKLCGDRRVQQWSCILLLVTIFLAFFLFLYAQFQTATLQTLAEVSSDFVEWVNTVSNASNENIKTSAMQMFYTSSIRALRAGKDLSASERTVGLRDLGNFVGSSDFLDSVMVYNGALDLIFTSEGNHPSAPSGQFHDGQAVEILTHPESYPYLSPIKRSGAGKDCYSFLFFEQNGSHSSALLLNVNARWYESQLLGVSSTERHIIVNGAGQPVVFRDEELSGQIGSVWAALQGRIADSPDGGYLLPSVFSDEPCWLYHRLDKPGWYYLESLRFDAISPGLTRVRDCLFLSFGLAGGFLLLALIHLLLRVYLPFRGIRDALRLSGRDVGNLPMQVNELVEQQREKEVERQLRRLREGAAPPELPFPTLLLLADDPDPEALQRLLLPFCPGVLTAREEEEWSVAVLPGSGEEIRAALLPALTGPGAPGLYLGLPCQEPQALRESFAALDELRKLRFLYPDRRVLCQELLSQCNAVSGFQAKMAAALVAALKSGQLESARAEWGAILDAIRRDRYNDFCFAVRTLCKQLGTLERELGLESTASADGILPGLQSLETLQEHLDRLMERTAAAAAQRQRERLGHLCGRVWQQIREHYEEENLSAQQIAERFEVNAAYLNRQFRQAAGMSISDAIHQIRIEQARRLLLDTGEPAELIAQRVGYSNIKYFFVVFKKLTGCTPRQFREEKTATTV